LRFGRRGGKIHASLNMQTQDAPAEIIFKLWPWLEANKNRLIGGTVVALIIAGIVFYVSSSREQREITAGLALTTLINNQSAATSSTQLAASLEQLATTYAGTGAAQRAELQAAGVLFAAGNYADAQTQFQKCITEDRSGPFAATAQLGVAASLESLNKLDLAASAYQQVLSTYPGSPFVAQAEFGLGHIAELQNKPSEAVGHYDKVAATVAGGTLAQEAAMRSAELKFKLAAAAPAAATLAQPVAAPNATAASQPAAKP